MSRIHLSNRLPNVRKVFAALGSWCFRSALSPIPLLVLLAAIGLIAAIVARTESGTAGRICSTPYDRVIRQAAREHMPRGWDWRLLKAMVRQESNFKPAASSRVGAVGLCQLMPSTAASLGVSREALKDPRVNIDCGVRYLRMMWDKWPSLDDVPPRWERSRFAIASYNCGPGRLGRLTAKVDRLHWSVVGPQAPKETQTHIAKVFGEYYPAYRRLHLGTAVGLRAPRRPKLSLWSVSHRRATAQ